MKNIINIKGGSYADVKKALRQWIDLYSKTLDDSITFELYKNGRGKHLIKADDLLDNENFFYLINYLKYPENINYKIDITGYTTGKDLKEFANQNIQVYIDKNDSTFDNVNVVTEKNKAFKFDFGGKVKELSGHISYTSMNVIDLSSPETLKIRKQVQKDNNPEPTETRTQIKKRFRVALLILLGLIASSFLFLLKDKDMFVTMNFFIGIGISIWFFSDYKMLCIEKYYMFSLLTAGLFLGYGFLLKSTFLESTELVDLGSLFAFSFLVIQKPFRFLYKQVFKREPTTEYIPQNWGDLIYTILLFLSFVIIPFWINDKIG